MIEFEIQKTDVSAKTDGEIKPGQMPVVGRDIRVVNANEQSAADLTAAILDAAGYEYGTK